MPLYGKTFHLKGVVQHYAWGGYDFIPALLHIPNEARQPCAEYWMGAHPSAPSLVTDGTQTQSLQELIKADPVAALTEKVYNRFGELPYLFKILDVKDMLSIQVHPSRQEAIKGFEAEEAAGIPLHAPHRNYKDKNHKPEVMVALSEFWLLHGFKPQAAIEQTLLDIQEFSILVPLFKREGIKGLFQFVMEMEQEDADIMLAPVVKRAISRKANNEISKEHPGWWVSKLYEGKEDLTNIDKGVFSIYLFNIVRINPGEAIFQGAGIPHAYLEGQNIELMANSDNVLRGGLTNKHVDVRELMKHTLFESITPNVAKGNSIGNHSINYPCPVPDFGIHKIDLDSSRYTATAQSLEIIIAIEGGAAVNGSNSIALKKGEAIAILPGEEYKIEASGKCLLFKAFVPV